MLGIVVAMDQEMELLLSNLNKKDFQKKEDVFTKYEFDINDRKIVAVVSGVGKIKASGATEHILSNYEISKVLNFGMAGGIDKSVEIGEIVNIIKSFDYDEDLSAFGHDKVVRDLIEMDDFDYKKGICVSGDKFLNDTEESKNVNKDYKALCYEMELSAISMICNMHNVPIISLKYISDKADENAEFDFYESLKAATKSFSKFLINVINDL